MDDFLAKPYDLDQLRTMLQRWMSIPQARPADASASPRHTAAAPRPAAEPPAAATTTPTTAAAATAIDREHLEQFRELDPAGGLSLAARIMRVYATTSPGLVTQLKTATQGGDAEGLRQAAHSLKSSSANVGAATLSALLRQLEACGKEGRLRDAAAALDELSHEYGRVMGEIDSILAEIE
jgi:HPt (histidine-containing phosphotransfer) domain-containing protein